MIHKKIFCPAFDILFDIVWGNSFHPHFCLKIWARNEEETFCTRRRVGQRLWLLKLLAEPKRELFLFLLFCYFTWFLEMFLISIDVRRVVGSGNMLAEYFIWVQWMHLGFIRLNREIHRVLLNRRPRTRLTVFTEQNRQARVRIPKSENRWKKIGTSPEYLRASSQVCMKDHFENTSVNIYSSQGLTLRTASLVQFFLWIQKDKSNCLIVVWWWWVVAS